jgi:microsomal dipeptidase-like Zn-dependent dipeptidase
MENRVFDFHYHLLFKHQICTNKNIQTDVTVKGVGALFNDVMGGAFDSQSSPSQVKNSALHLGVIALITIEHAFANRIFHVLGEDFSKILPLDRSLFDRTREGKTNYYKEFLEMVDFYMSKNIKNTLSGKFNIQYLDRRDFPVADFSNKEKILGKLEADKDIRYMAFSIEGGHNLSNMPVHNQETKSMNPELQLKEIQDNGKLDFMSMTLCHLSEIPEQSLGGFAQGLNRLSQIAFSSEDFMPKTGLGISALGKKVVFQALTHERPILIDLRHMSLYTRLHYYKVKEKLAIDFPDTTRLPLISSHSGFTFTSVTDYITNKKFRSTTFTDNLARLICEVEPENRSIGKTNDTINKKLWCNPWSINLFDDEIVTIMESRGMIGISMDQRVLGATKMAVDSKHPRYFEKESVPEQEWKKLFRDGQLPSTESLLDVLGLSAPSRPERHIMLFCLHIVHAVRLGLAHLSWPQGTSPWDHICIGSDYDGLINPINGFDSITDIHKLRDQLLKYLPVADSYLTDQDDEVSAIPRQSDKKVDMNELTRMIEKFLFTNGQDFMIRFLSNWRL